VPAERHSSGLYSNSCYYVFNYSIQLQLGGLPPSILSPRLKPHRPNSAYEMVPTLSMIHIACLSDQELDHRYQYNYYLQSLSPMYSLLLYLTRAAGEVTVGRSWRRTWHASQTLRHNHAHPGLTTQKKADL